MKKKLSKKQASQYAIKIFNLEKKLEEAAEEKDKIEIQFKIESLAEEIVSEYGFEAMLEIDEIICSFDRR